MADERTTEELTREKIMLEIEKLRRDMLLQDERFKHDRLSQSERFAFDKAVQDRRLRREGWQLVIAAIGGTAILFGAAATFLKVLLG